MTEPVFQPPAEPRTRGRRTPTSTTLRRECGECGWAVDLADGQYVPPHNQLVMTKRGLRFSDRPCDGSRQPPADPA
jgi:hypothetical protein